ncbi:hypothetical protein ACP4OV_020541 [Aristida adscensionis]
MAYRVLDVTLQSARDLKRVNLITRMEVYGVVTISGDPLTRQCTQPDRYGGRHPSWNTTFRFNVPPAASAAGGCLHVLLRTERAMGDRDVGEVIVPLADILSGAAASDPGPRPPQSASYQVRKVHRCEPRGKLNLSFRLGPVVAPQAPPPQPAAARAAEHAPVVAYPDPRSFYPPPYAYLPPPLPLPPLPPPPPPPRQAAGHDAMTMQPPTPPARPGNSYNQPAAAYQQAAGAGRAAPPAPASTTEGKGNGGGDKLDFGVGLGAGLVSGAIGGMLAGDMMSDVAAYYNSGYRAGLADGGAAVAYKNPHVPQVDDYYAGVTKAHGKGESNWAMV